MMRTNSDETFNQVKSILEENKKARLSDNALLVVYYMTYGDVDVDNVSIREFYRMIEEKKILTTRYVLRVARKVKEQHPHLKANQPSRDSLSENYKKEFSN